MNLNFVSMATLINQETGIVYLSITLSDKNDVAYTWDMSLEDATENHFDMAFCITGMRDIVAKQKRAQQIEHPTMNYAESE